VSSTIRIKGSDPIPAQVAFCGSKIFVSENGPALPEKGRIVVISPSQNKIVKTISGFISPGSLFCNANLLWIQDSTFVRILNASTYKFVRNISGSAASDFGYSPKTKQVYVDNDNGTIFVYNPTTFQLVANLAGGPSSGQFAYNPLNKAMYLTNSAGFPSASIFIINSANKLTQLNFTSNCSFRKALIGIAYSPATKQMYLTCLIDNDNEGTVIILNAETNAVNKTIPVGFDTGSIIYNPSNKDMYVASAENLLGNHPGIVAVISDVNVLVASINVENAGCLAVS
jgi:DNA-binding beta-propeller fold protein YncE